MNQKDVFSKTSRPAFAVWALWGLIVLALVWPARERTNLPTIDDAHPTYVVNGVQERLTKTGNYRTTFTIGFEHPSRVIMLDYLAIKVGTFHKTVELLNMMISSDLQKCRLEGTENIEIQRQLLQDLGYLQLPLNNLRKCIEHGQNSKDVLYSLILETSSPVAMIAGSKPFDLVENPMPFVRGPNGANQLVDGLFLQSQIGDSNWLKRLSWPRFRLMASVWGAESFPGILVFLFLLISGASLFCWSVFLLLKRDDASFNKSLATRTAAAFVGASLLTSLIAPPFQAADEADHFRTFLTTTGIQHRDDEALKLAQRGHYDRLMCHRDQRLSVKNLECAMLNGWPAHAGTTDGPARSLVADFVWKGLAKIFPLEHLNIALIHWGIRLFNGLFVALAFFIALNAFNKNSSELANEDTKATLVQLSTIAGAVAVIAVPTLTHFANHNSNHAFLIAAYIVLAVASLKILAGLRLGRRTTFILSFSTTLAVFAGRAGVLLWLVTLGLFAIRWLTQNMNSDTHRPYRPETIHSISIFLPSVFLGVLLNEHPYVQVRLLPLFQNRVSMGLFALVSAVVLLPTILMTLGNAAQRAFKTLEDLISIKTWAINVPWRVISGVLFAIYLVSALFKTPTSIPNIEFTPPISATNYVWLVLKSFIRNSAPGGDDFLLIGSFWGGFGCPVDSLHWFPLWIIQSFLMGGWIFGLFANCGRSSTSETVRYCGFGLLCFSYLGMLTYAVHSGPSTMHGRYMVGFYLLFIVGALWGWSRAFPNITPRQSRNTIHILYISAFFLQSLGIFSLVSQFY